MIQYTTRKRIMQAAGTAALAAAILGGGMIAAAPNRVPVAEACVVRAQETGFCVIAGRPAEIVRVAELYSEIPQFIGAVPVIIGEAENAVNQAEAAPYTEEELELLACVIYCEAGGDACTDDTRRMVGEVVLNRAADLRFPDTIAGVLTQKYQYGLFWRTGVVWPARAAHEPEAVERAYDCARLVLTEERLLPEDTVWQAEFMQGTECVVHVPGFYFCR